MKGSELGRLSPSERALMRGIALEAGEPTATTARPVVVRPVVAPTPAAKAVVFFPVPVVVPGPAPKPAPKPRAQAPQPEPASFDAVRFHADLKTAARQLGVTTQPELAKDAGVREQAIQCMKRGLAPSLATCLVLCDWAGLDPLQYLVRLAPAAANDSSVGAAA